MNADSNDAETRKQTVRSLMRVVATVGITGVDSEVRCQILETFYKGFDDYAVDRRGDVGSWVRQESMLALNDYISCIIGSENLTVISSMGADTPQFYERFISFYLQQLNEKIDRIREHAGRTLQRFFKYTVPKLEGISFSLRDELTCLFMQEDHGSETGLASDVAFLPWRSAKFVFDHMKALFSSEVYSIPILKGLITSSGGLTESTVKASQNSLFEYLSEVSKTKNADGSVNKEAGIKTKQGLLQKLMAIFELNVKVDRVTVPLMKTTEMLLAADYLSDPEIQPTVHEVHRLTVQECNKSKNIVKLIAGVGVLAGMLSSPDPELQAKAIKSLLFMLYQTFPKLRVLAAEKLYTGLLTMEEYTAIIPGGEAAYDEVNELLSETDWSQPVRQLAEETKVRMYAYFGFEAKLTAAKQ